MDFTELQSKLLIGMLDSIDNFREGKLSYSTLIYGLEGALDAGEFHDNEIFVKRWYDYWTPLEILYSTKGDNVTYNDAVEYLVKMKNFLKTLPRIND